MINKLNGVQTINFQYKPAFKAKEDSSVTVPETNVSFKGSEVLAAYNMPKVNVFDKKLLDFEPVQSDPVMPESADSIEGEKIYSSDGKLHSIVNRTGKTTVVYNADPENENLFKTITTTDKDTGNIVKKQYNNSEDGEYTGARVFEYDPETGKEISFVRYKDGELTCASKTTYNENGSSLEVYRDFEDNTYSVYAESPDGKLYRSMKFNKDKQLTNVYQEKQLDLFSSKTTDVDFYNGAILSVRESKTTTVPNVMGQEVLNDPDLTPAELVEDPQGEKTYYSNGSLETVTSGNLVYSYSPDGDLEKITENLGEDITKTTRYDKDGSVEVVYNNGDYSKSLCLDENSIPQTYSEEEGEDLYRDREYNDKGMLESVWGNY